MSPALASVTSPVPRANTAGLLSRPRAAASAGPSDIPVVPPNVQRRIAAEAHGLKPDARLDGGFAGFPEPPRRAAGRGARQRHGGRGAAGYRSGAPMLDVAAMMAQVAALDGRAPPRPQGLQEARHLVAACVS